MEEKKERKPRRVDLDEDNHNQRHVIGSENMELKDREHLLSQMFSLEIWTMVLEKISDPVDLENCILASPFFEDLLQGRLLEYLFPKIMPILGNWSKKNERHCRVCDDDGFDSSSDSDSDDNETCHCHLYSPVFGKLNVFNIRLVCKSWNKGVQNALVNHAGNFSLDPVVLKHLNERNFLSGNSDCDDSDEEGDEFSDGEESNARVEDGATSTYFTFHCGEKIEDFLETFEDSHGDGKINPFCDRKISLEEKSYLYPNHKETTQFWNSITKLLTKYGRHVWFFDIQLKHSIFMSTPYYQKVREWLTLLPNLQVFYWSFPISRSDLESDTNDEDSTDNDCEYPIFLKTKLEPEVKKSSMPKMEKLKYFKTDDLPPPIFRDFMEKNGHVEKLQFHRKFPPTKDYEEIFNYGFDQFRLPNATEFSFVVWNTAEVQQMATQPDQWSNLKKLNLYYAGGYQEWNPFLQLVEQKCTTNVTEMTIRLPPLTNWYNPQPTENEGHRLLRWQLPYLQHLKIFLPGPSSIDFLLPLKNTLKRLHIVMERDYNNRRTESESTPEVVQYTDFHHKMNKSNIWQEFPMLDSLKFETRCLESESRCLIGVYNRKQIQGI